jgi:hypothetical protein
MAIGPCGPRATAPLPANPSHRHRRTVTRPRTGTLVSAETSTRNGHGATHGLARPRTELRLAFRVKLDSPLVPRPTGGAFESPRGPGAPLNSKSDPSLSPRRHAAGRSWDPRVAMPVGAHAQQLPTRSQPERKLRGGWCRRRKLELRVGCCCGPGTRNQPSESGFRAGHRPARLGGWPVFHIEPAWSPSEPESQAIRVCQRGGRISNAAPAMPGHTVTNCSPPGPKA